MTDTNPEPAALSDEEIKAFYDRYLAREDAHAAPGFTNELRQHYVDGVRLNRAATATIIRSRDLLAWLHVEEGEVEVSTAELVIDHPDVRVWEVDLVTKHADVLSYNGDEVLLRATEHTSKVNESQRGKATRIRLGAPTSGWTVIAECGRYTCVIAAYRYRDTP
jgi:hypothetical protein